MDKSKFEKMSLSELFMLIRNGSGATALSASEEIERRLSAQQSVQADGFESEPKCYCHSEGVSPSCPVHGNRRR